MNRGLRALGASMARRGFGYMAALTLLVTLAGSAGMYAFENNLAAGRGFDSYWSALWWTLMIMTTMDSEFWPRTAEGRVLCVLLALYAFGVFGYVTAALAPAGPLKAWGSGMSALKVRTVTVVTTFLLTTAGWLLILNLTLGDKQIDERFETGYSVADPQLQQVVGALLGPPIVGGNRVQALLNGDEIFPSMLDAIRGARHTVTFETYIYWSGTIGREIADMLIERAHSGVRVHVMLDWWGSDGIEDLHLQTMRAAGVEVRRYSPPCLNTLSRMNHRTHRRLLVVDRRRAALKQRARSDCRGAQHGSGQRGE